ncbi:hypothetical protein, partial [Serratia ureilytica]|uniref:hypothetical protein n=1 Tax=Serratia ureilytica TaxID=300181 RepID=UPI001D183452
KTARLVDVVRDARAEASLVGNLAFPRQRVAIPPVQREAALQLAVALNSLGTVPARPRLASFLVVRLAVLEQAPAEGIVEMSLCKLKCNLPLNARPTTKLESIPQKYVHNAIRENPRLLIKRNIKIIPINGK